MHTARRSALRTPKRLQSRTQRRFESSHHDNAGPHHHNTEPVKESLPRGLFVAIGAGAVFYGVYSATTGDAQNKPALTRLIDYYSDFKTQWEDRNTMHTKMVEQAAFDRNLFQSDPGSKMIDLKFPEQFNVGSPRNVHAGHSADLSQLIAHYQEQNRKMAERVEKRLESERSSKQSSAVKVV